MAITGKIYNNNAGISFPWTAKYIYGDRKRIVKNILQKSNKTLNSFELGLPNPKISDLFQ